MKSDVARLCLGTAQFGSHYGATNKAGKPSREEIARILDCADEAGIRWLDTAASYATHLLHRRAWKIVTKLTARDLYRAEDFFGADVILAHEPAAGHLVLACREAGYKSKIGQSIYWQEYIWPWAEVVQLPLNLADRRFTKTPQSWGRVIFARSVFLQGKLLEMGYTVAQCLGYVLRQPVDYAVVGVNSVGELEQIIRVANDLPEHVADIPAPKLTAEELDPRTWNS
jgi:aryl-alcohol dehydrogenase-like predicted oxidoreductase